jgi:hypothetical protein
LGDDLVSLMLYGSAARGTHVPGRSDVNVLLVVRDASAATLNRAAPALNDWIALARTPPLIQSEADWKASADVFPIEVEDIRDGHRLLAGRDVVTGLATTHADLRQELEREARGKLIRLRAEYAVAASDGQRLAELLVRATSTFLVLFRAGLRLAGSRVPSDPEGVIRAMAHDAGFEPTALSWVLAERARARPAALKSFDPIAADYLLAIEKFVRFVNDVQ